MRRRRKRTIDTVIDFDKTHLIDKSLVEVEQAWKMFKELKLSQVDKEQTREHLEKIPMCSMKNSNGSQGFASLKEGIYKLVNTRTKQLYIFKSLHELYEAGWRLD